MIRRRITHAASAFLLLAAGACSAPASEDASGTTTVPALDADAGSPGPLDGSPSTSIVATSPLAERTRPIGSATYDPAEHQARTRFPSGLRIGELGIDGAPIISVGVEPDGEMEIPPADEVGWYRFGSAPGEPGSSVLAAHVAYDGVDGVFRYLDRLDPGAIVEVAFDDGTTERFEVVEVTSYLKDELPDDVFDPQADERLVLITCGGDFNPSLRSYESNIVAYAVPA